MFVHSILSINVAAGLVILKTIAGPAGSACEAIDS
jgi:arginine repressor